MIAIIGSGRVGSAIAYLCAATALDDVILVNRTKEKAMGQALDISNATQLESPVSVIGTDDYSMIKNSDVIVISASVATYEKNRMEFMPQHVQLIKDVAKKASKYSHDSKIVLVTNPVDILTYVFVKETDLPRNSIIGVAASLDSSRFRYVLANELGVKMANITGAVVLGEHGDSMVPLFSQAKVDEKPVLSILKKPQIDKITNDVRYYWKSIRRLKGPSVFGIAKNTTDVVRAIINNEELAAPVSLLLKGEYGISDVCLGVPSKINQDGASIIEIKISDSELKLLHKSATAVKNYIHLLKMI